MRRQYLPNKATARGEHTNMTYTLQSSSAKEIPRIQAEELENLQQRKERYE